MICLVDSFEVICFHHDVNFKIAYVCLGNLLYQGVADCAAFPSHAVVDSDSVLLI
jgi:hypothetical protein